MTAGGNIHLQQGEIGISGQCKLSVGYQLKHPDRDGQLHLQDSL